MTSSEEMDELLARLEKFDKETFLEIYILEHKCNEIDDHIQGCIQRACERRDWNWLVNSLIGTFGEYAGIIVGVSSAFGNSPAEALLKAYLAALEAEKK